MRLAPWLSLFLAGAAFAQSSGPSGSVQTSGGSGNPLSHDPDVTVEVGMGILRALGLVAEDQGDGLRGVNLIDNTADCRNPVEGDTSLCSKQGGIWRRDTDGTSWRLLDLDIGCVGDICCDAGECLIDAGAFSGFPIASTGSLVQYNGTNWVPLLCPDGETIRWVSGLAACVAWPSGGGGGGDTDPPDPIDDLATSSPTTTKITLSWTTPAGTPTTNDCRTCEPLSGASDPNVANCAGSAMVIGDWGTTTTMTVEPSTGAESSPQSFQSTTPVLQPNTTYSFGCRTSDAAGNPSLLSNVVSGTTSAGPSVTLVNTTSHVTASQTTAITIDKPGSAQNGDVMIGLLCRANAEVVWTPPTGWTNEADFGTTTGNDIRSTVYVHPVTDAGSEPGTYTWTDSSSNAKRLAGAIVLLRGVDSSVFDAISDNSQATIYRDNDSTPAATSITTLTTNALLFAWNCMSGASNPMTEPTGMTEDHDIGSNQLSLALAHVVQPTPGATGDKEWTALTGIDGTEDANVWLIAIKPAP